MILATVAVLALICAWIPAVMFCINLAAYARPPALGTHKPPAVSILIPARDEAHAITHALRAALATRHVEFEVVVMDDASTDGTDALVLALAQHDPRVRLVRAPALPPGWNGKQHACWALAHAARNPILCFVDADVRLGPECVARMAAFLQSGKAVSSAASPGNSPAHPSSGSCCPSSTSCCSASFLSRRCARAPSPASQQAADSS